MDIMYQGGDRLHKDLYCTVLSKLISSHSLYYKLPCCYLIITERTTLVFDKDKVKADIQKHNCGLSTMSNSTDGCCVFSAKHHVIWILRTNLFDLHDKHLWEVWLIYLTTSVQSTQTTAFKISLIRTNKLQAQWSSQPNIWVYLLGTSAV